MPLVSICLPTLNARRFLDDRMSSILAQTLSDWELIVGDSHSDDGTWEFLQSFRNDPRVRLYQVPRAGLYAGWNECLRRARGAFVYMAPADDTADPALLETMTAALAPHPDVDLAVCDFDFIDDQGHRIDPPRGTARTFFGDWLQRPHRRDRRLELLVHLCLDISWTTMTAVLFRRSLLDQAGLFDTGYGAFGDRFWAIRSAMYTDTIFVPGRLATWRWHADQGSKCMAPSLRRRIVTATAAELDAHAGQLPPAWRSDAAWREKLLWGPRNQYHDGLGLNRLKGRRNPARFLCDFGRTLMIDPRYALRRLRDGFCWDLPSEQDEHDYVRRLAAAWDVPGPQALGPSGEHR